MKESIILDKTYKPAEIESKGYELWERSYAFKAMPNQDSLPYCIMMPPPNVTGSLHMGHALNNTLQDVLTRYHRMLGQDVLWQPGMDHAGIATQMVVERKLENEGINRKHLGRDSFVNKIWEWKEESGGSISTQLRRLGASADWQRERFTMDPGLSTAVRKVFVQLYREGLIYRDKRLVNWDPKLQTAISDLEVEQREEANSSLWYFRYKFESDKEKYIVVATTRPETIFGDVAIAVNPKDRHWSNSIGSRVELPISGRLIPIIEDDYADPEQGSGAVKITPAHDFNDFIVGKKHNLEMINIFDSQAKLNDNVPDNYVGLDRYEAREKILQELEELNLLEKVEQHTHTLPYGDRSGVVIEPWLTDQWYVNAEVLAKPAIEAVKSGRIKFIPKQWENTYFEWMNNIQPWCISRQLWWGHRIPAWYGPDGELFVANDEEEAQKSAEIHYGKAVDLIQDDDVLDTWFSSGLWPFSTLGWPESEDFLKRYYPNNDLITGFDIIFFWVARMIMLGMHFMGDIPFKNVYIHALVRDEQGQKMSKSKGNVIDPIELIDKYGADALRFTLVAMEAQGRDIKLSESRVEGYRNFATKLWNAARFCESNQCIINDDYEPSRVKLSLNKWIIGELIETTNNIENAFSNYRFNEIARVTYQFVWGTFCDWYLEFAKIPLSSGSSEEIEETRNTTGWVLENILHLLHPIMPFVTEELWNRSSKHRSRPLILSKWPTFPDKYENKSVSSEINWVKNLITELRIVRSEMNVPAKAIVPILLSGMSQINTERLDRYKHTIAKLARVSEFKTMDCDIPSDSIQIIVDETTIVLPLSGIIDFSKERLRLSKEIKKYELEIEKIDNKLQNKQFMSRAPQAVIEEQKIRKESAEEALKKVHEAQKRINV